MRSLFVIILLAAVSSASAQLYIGPGAQLQVSGNMPITLHAADLINHGSFSTGNSTMYMTGDATTVIGGNLPITFHILHINKQGGSSLRFGQTVVINNTLQFIDGLVDLNGHDLELGSTGILLGESAKSHLIGTNGGEIRFAALLNAPAGVNPGNLGATISSPKNLGLVKISRGHQPLTLPGGKSIGRYYTITPANNSGLAATLRFQYLDTELGALTKNELVMWRSPDAVTWVNQKFDSRDMALNYVEKTGIDAFSTWTLAASPDALPVTFAAFRLSCEAGKAGLYWTTSQESNSSHFTVERNKGAGWESIAQVPATGNSSTEKNYTYTDRGADGPYSYRIAQYDLDGRVQYTGLLRATCAAFEAIHAWPNPVRQTCLVSIQSSQNTLATLRVINSAGITIISKQCYLRSGINQLPVDLRQAPAGMYQLQLTWGAAQQRKTLQLVKQ